MFPLAQTSSYATASGLWVRTDCDLTVMSIEKDETEKTDFDVIIRAI